MRLSSLNETLNRVSQNESTAAASPSHRIAVAVSGASSDISSWVRASTKYRRATALCFYRFSASYRRRPHGRGFILEFIGDR
jgi:hypothetical protein